MPMFRKSWGGQTVRGGGLSASASDQAEARRAQDEHDRQRQESRKRFQDKLDQLEAEQHKRREEARRTRRP
jgi:hypothetical protein